MMNINHFTVVLMIKIFGILFCCTLAFAIRLENKINPIVHSPTGSFRGSIWESYSGRNFYAFRSIRYAEAPTGRNRFKEASLARRHSGIFDATQRGPVCALPYKNEEISEDCLRLNIYMPTSSQNQSGQDSQSSKPVIVFLHPGSYWESFGSSYGLGPHYALDQDIVLVTPNYRLGTLGFLSTGDERAPGNAGLKDQVLALEWIQQNIGAFGGDPNLVLLAGEDIGAASVAMHIASPMSSGLFHSALIISPVGLNVDSLPSDRTDLAKKQAQLLGCLSEISDEMFNCLAGKSAKEFADTHEQLTAYNGHSVVFTPVVERVGTNNGGRIFLDAQMSDIVRQGKANYVPIIIGVNSDEFLYITMEAEMQSQSGRIQLYDEFNNNWAEVAPKIFNYERGTANSSRISAGLRQFYLYNQPLGIGSFQSLGNLYSDALVNVPTHQFERLMASYSSQPVFYYQYNFQHIDSYKTWSNGTHFGVVHNDELFALFTISGRRAPDEESIQRSKELWKWNKNFAKYGNPMGAGEPGDYFRWEPSTKMIPQYLEYNGEEKKMTRGIINQQRMNEWDKLFPSL